jgi:hypothetical protein
MSRIVLTQGSVEFPLGSRHLLGLVEYIEPLLFQLLMRQHDISAGNVRLAQLLDGFLYSAGLWWRHGWAGFTSERARFLQGQLCRSRGLAGSGGVGLLVGTRARRGCGHRDLHTVSRTIDTLTTNCAESRGVPSDVHLLRVHVMDLDRDVDLMIAEADDAAVVRHGLVAEAARVVVDEAERAELLREATDHALAGGDEGSRPDENSSQRRCWPHGGRQLSTFGNDRNHG